MPAWVMADIGQARSVFQQLAQMPAVRAHFEQQKSMASLNRTFSSQGEVLFSQQYGVLWQIKQPVQADLIVTEKKLIQKTQRTMSEMNIQQSEYGSMATLFLQLMAGDEATLVKNFNLNSIEKNNDQWKMQLTPKNALFKKLFDRVDMQGTKYLDQIVLHEKEGNSTTIRFRQQSAQPQQLNVQEYALFQLAK
ncbi:outer membrane lipoprotein carrier protein LolA [Acinetobacter rathckeae]|uniref:outer membrane lipoprotein carrier protein LolA n=1 Tax=Acinetobacter rathckeae TaxID=2605272 RepID=UPI001D196B99|nr:outer membrane lipoprotein carrier protein LolA [Acinetobacter rathckeae]